MQDFKHGLIGFTEDQLRSEKSRIDAAVLENRLFADKEEYGFTSRTKRDNKVIKEINKIIEEHGINEAKQYIDEALETKTSAAASSSSGPKVKGRGKVKRIAKAKTLPVIEEEIELIAPPQTGLNYLDIMNDPYLINKIN